MGRGGIKGRRGKEKGRRARKEKGGARYEGDRPPNKILIIE